jgi:peptidoglycan hydrolase-like protein with peptidoglycan-binding domain
MPYQSRFREESFETDSEFDEMSGMFTPELTNSEWNEETSRQRRLTNQPSKQRAGGRPRPIPGRPPFPPQHRQPGKGHPRPVRVVGGPSVIVREPWNPLSDTAPGRESSEYIRWVQNSLNQILGLQLPVNGRMGVETRSAVRSFQEKNGLPVDGMVGPDTERALLAAKGGQATTAGPEQPAAPKEFEAFDNEWEDLEWEEEVNRSSREYAMWVQQSLNKIMSLRLDVDGIIGTMSRAAIRDFQQRKGLTSDGIVGPITEAALIAAGAGSPPGGTPSYSGGAPSVGVTPEGLVPVPGIENTSTAFRLKVINIARSLGTDPNFMMAIMSFESNGFNPAIRNPYSGATGLIQFTSPTARKLGTTTEALARMTAEQQLDYVAKYFAEYKGRLKTLEDTYMAVLWPKAIGQSSSYVLFSSPSSEYQGNSHLDANKDGKVTVAEAIAPVRKRLGSAAPAIGTSPLPPSSPPASIGSPDIVSVRGFQVARHIAPQLEALLAAAEAEGIRLGNNSSYRSPEEQIALRRKYCGPTEYDIYHKSPSQCSPQTALPGTSNHEKGLAIDFSYGGTKMGSGNPGFQWLVRNAARFGFYNLPSEPWHWSVDGK